MTTLTIRHLTPHKLLQPFIYKMWVLEGTFRAAASDLMRMSPNGTVKLILMYKGGLKGANDTMTRGFPESNLIVIGQMTNSTIVDTLGDTGSIGIEFYPWIFRLFNFPLSDLTNRYFSGDEIFGPVGNRLQSQIADTSLIEGKIALIENFLLQRLYSSRGEDTTMDYALRQIVSKHGLLTIKDLYTDIGFSKRHFDRKFKIYAGISPKELATIRRFHTVYQRGWQVDFKQIQELKEYYYDQSHFVKEFRKYTGTSPTTYFRQTGRFAKVFYM